MVGLEADRLLSAYAQGVFPMADAHGRIRWYTADPRGIIPLEGFHVPRTLESLLRRQPPRFEVRINGDFCATMRACMQARREGTWITPELVEAYGRLHELGHAHSVECWRNGRMVGGLYGVSVGAAFFGESMFHTETDASKVALVHLVQRLRERGFELLDTQACTPHLRRFGCIEISAAEYGRRLRRAIVKQRTFA